MDYLHEIDWIQKQLNCNRISHLIAPTLSIALECEDYHGYCILSLWNCPLSDTPEANRIHRQEMIRTMMLHGLSKEDACKVERDSLVQYLNMKSISEGDVNAHSVKEMESWFSDVQNLMDAPDAAYADMNALSQRKDQLSKIYESLRAYILSKTTYYREVIKMREKRTKVNSLDNLKLPINPYSKIFIVHGHNGELKEAIARLIERQGIEAIILHEQANLGNTIIEKFERNSDVGAAICLFTADDVGRAKADNTERKRARQNVVFEAGYFIGKLGRKNVVIIADPGVEIPSDMQGIVCTGSENWQFSVLKELKAMGFNIDYNKLT